MSKTKRQAGRSTATLRNALEILRSGSDVSYIVINRDQAVSMCSQAKDILKEIDPSGIYRFEKSSIRGSGAFLRFFTLSDSRHGSDAVVVPDHASFEMLERLYLESLCVQQDLRLENENLKSPLGFMAQDLINQGE